MLDIVIAWILAFLASIAPNVGAFLVMCLLDVGLGIAAAIRRKQFQWSKVAEFYWTSVLSYLLGWFIFALCGALLANYLSILGEYKAIASTAWVNGTWLFLVAKMFASIGNNFKELYGKDLTPAAWKGESDARAG